MRPIYIAFLGFELMIEPTTYSGFSYIQESAKERELQIGKVRVIISKATSLSHLKIELETF